MKPVCLLVAALLFTAVFLPASAQGIRATVTKQATRVARPQESEQDVPSTFTLSAQQVAGSASTAAVSDDGFALKATKIDAGAMTGWSSYGLGERAKLAPSPPLGGQSIQSAAAAPVAVDYEAIEKAYAEAVPRPAAPPNLNGTAHSTPGLAVATPYVMAAIANGSLTAAGTPTGLPPQAAPPHVAVDNCICDTAIPSAHCTTGRMMNFGINAGAAPTIGVPGAAPAVMPPMMHGR